MAALSILPTEGTTRRSGRSGGVDQIAEFGRLTGMHPYFGKFMDFGGGEYGVGRAQGQRVALDGVQARGDGASRAAELV